MTEKRSIKILSTLGPRSLDPSVLQALDKEGVDIFRLNLSHVSPQVLPGIIENVQKWTNKTLCLDTQGAQIRTGTFTSDKITLQTGATVTLVTAETIGSETVIPIYPVDPATSFQVGDIIQLDFNSVLFQIQSIHKGTVTAKVLHGGVVGSNKGIGLERRIPLPPLTDVDLESINIATHYGLTHFALSFASHGDNVQQLRQHVPYPITLISKIENISGLVHLRSICEHSDALLIDRGDIGREVSVQKIGLAQDHILSVVRSFQKPLYVATNLLDSMMERLQPNRAEINDITSSLMNGASGLVLAAETAVGRYPVKCVQMIKRIIDEVSLYKTLQHDAQKVDYLSAPSFAGLIRPHGGYLVQNDFPDSRESELEKAPVLEVDPALIMDVFQIATGAYSPLRGFMDRNTVHHVLDHNTLPSGEVWTLPIVFQIQDGIPADYRGLVKLKLPNSTQIVGAIDVTCVETLDIAAVTRPWFGTDDDDHPGVHLLKSAGSTILSGPCYMLSLPEFLDHPHVLTPRKTRLMFNETGKSRIVAFHTRNVVHVGHEFIQKEALRQTDADTLFISPVIGKKKAGDFPTDMILDSYKTIIETGIYHPHDVVLGGFATFSRYGGPREAVFTAICRKNFGCNYIIIGRDHTGVKDYYGPQASQDIFASVGDIDIQPIFFDAAYFCTVCGRATFSCSHSKDNRLVISATRVRESLKSGDPSLDFLIRPEVKDVLKSHQENPR